VSEIEIFVEPVEVAADRAERALEIKAATREILEKKAKGETLVP
jgi:hypothetical protein